MKRLNKLKGMYALLVAVAAMIGITICGSCSADEDYDFVYHYGQELCTRAEREMGRSVEGQGLPYGKKDACGYWALLTLGVNEHILDSLTKHTIWNGGMSTDTVYAIAQQHLSFSHHYQGAQADSALNCHTTGDIITVPMIVYSIAEAHCGIAKRCYRFSVDFAEIQYEDKSGDNDGNIFNTKYVDDIGIMY